MKPLTVLNAGKLEVRVYGNRSDMGKSAATDAAERIQALVAAKGSANLVFAAAPSQNEFLAELKMRTVSWEKVRAFHLDEYIGLDSQAPQGFGNFLKAALFADVPLREVHYINGQTGDPAAECRRYEALLAAYPPDIVFLGIGENAHLAFNDPGVADFNDPAVIKVVELDPVCRGQQVNDGCFTRLVDVPKQAFTLTIPFLFAVPEALVVVPGETKRRAVYDTVFSPVSSEVPSSILRKHNNAVMYTDMESGGDLIDALGKETECAGGRNV